MLSALTLPEGTVGLLGSIRADDEGVDVFQISLTAASPFYGAWRPVFAQNGNDFHVEVLRFGYWSASNVGNPHPLARKAFSEAEAAAVEHLLRKMFTDVLERSKVLPFSMKKARFLEVVQFRAGWIFVRNS